MVSIRDLTEADLPLWLDYLFRSPKEYLEHLGIDLAKLPCEPDLEDSLRKRLAENRELTVSKLSALVITLDQRPVGMHTINPLVEGDYGVFHAHIWQPELRGRGIGRQSYPMACLTYFNRFGLQKLMFKTPRQNTAAIRVKEKLGIRFVGEETIGFGIIKEGTQSKVFEIERREALEMWGHSPGDWSKAGLPTRAPNPII